ncbi:hypothetical protein EOC94_23695 [Mesorhizobium sp. M6A.T.Ce.TU.016.01.1.1]|nr:hypothetical protein EOC94_23695 [Mesorhizobium sp. M6A.T.Ce.TU.016.01.1.1]
MKNGERGIACVAASPFSPSLTGRRCRQADEGRRHGWQLVRRDCSASHHQASIVSSKARPSRAGPGK